MHMHSLLSVFNPLNFNINIYAQQSRAFSLLVIISSILMTLMVN